MIGWGDSLDQRGNMESLQRDGLARVKAVDAFRLPVRQNNNYTCFCTVSRPTTDLNVLIPPPKKNQLCIVSEKTRWNTGDVMPKRIFIGILSMFTQKGLTLTLYIASTQDQKAPNDLSNQYNIDS